MNHSTKTILVSGATGRQGGAVVKHLKRRGFNIKALSRTPESVSARELISKGINVVRGDMADPASLLIAMQGCDGVFSIQNYFEYGAEKEIQYGKNMADAAKKSRVAHFIYNSACDVNHHTGIPHFESKNTIEQYIKSTGLPATILRPVTFFENYYNPQVFRRLLGGTLFDPVKGGKKNQFVAVDDVGAYVADAFSSPEKYLGRSIEIAGDELANEEIANTMAEVLGIKVKYRRLPMLVVRMVMDKDLYLMFKWFNEKGFTANIEAVKKNYPDVKVTSLREWLLNENWHRWNKKGSI